MQILWEDALKNWSLKLEKKKDGKVERSGTREAAVAVSTGAPLQWTREQVWLSGAVLTLERLRTAGSAPSMELPPMQLNCLPCYQEQSAGPQHSCAW